MNSFSFFKTCNHFPEKIFTHKGIDYFASDEDGALTFRGDIIVNLTKDPGTRAASNVYNIPELKNYMLPLPEEIVLGWTDFAKPPVRPEFWQHIHDYFKSKKFTQVLFHCQQGHGRTGTALAALLISLKRMTAKKAIDQIRQDHCYLCVESLKQIEYLLLLDNELNGRLLPETDEEADELIGNLALNK